MKYTGTYPETLTEEKTIELMDRGDYRGMARYGDGDFDFMRGQRDRFFKYDPVLAARIGATLSRPTEGVLNCLIPGPGRPGYDAVPGTVGAHRWLSYLEANAGIISLLPRTIYGSSNISRMDSCPWLHTKEWWLEVSKLWAGKDIALLAGTERSLTAAKLWESPNPPNSVDTPISIPPQNSQSAYAAILEDCLHSDVETFILCIGLTARPLVHDLVASGRKAYDLGHFGLWFKNGLPLPMHEVPR